MESLHETPTRAGGMVEGGPQPPNSIHRSSVVVLSSEEVRRRILNAAVSFHEIIHPTFGPHGLDKILYSPNGDISLTRDGAKVTTEMMVRHPAAKQIVELARAQESEIGDGVSSAVLLACSYIIEANELLENHIHPLILIDAWKEAYEIAKSSILELARPLKKQDLIHIAQTSLSGSSVEGAIETLAEVAVRAMDLLPVGYQRAEEIQMAKVLSSNLSQTRVIQGCSIEKRRPLVRGPLEIEDAKVLLITADLTAAATRSRDLEIEVKSATELQNMIEAEKDHLESLVEFIINCESDIILCSGTVDNHFLYRLYDQGCIVYSDLSSNDILNASKATGARPCESISNISTEDIGLAGKISIERIERDNGDVFERIWIEECSFSKVITIAVSGLGNAPLEETIRSIFDALRALEISLSDQRVVAGGGTGWSVAASAVRKVGRTSNHEKSKLYEGFARSLECIPRILLQNAGSNVIDGLLQLRQKNHEVPGSAGVSRDGTIH